MDLVDEQPMLILSPQLEKVAEQIQSYYAADDV
jgi:hypothetical protein